MQKERNRDNRSGVHAGSCTYVGKHSTKVLGIRDSGILKRKKFAHDI
jgi:hypothetical protein